MTPQELIDKALVLIESHLTQLRTTSTTMTKEGPKGLTAYDSQVIERYTKLLLAMTKTAADPDENLQGMSDEQLLELINESNEDNVHIETGEK